MIKNVLLLETLSPEATNLLISNKNINLIEVYKKGTIEDYFDQEIHAIITRGIGKVDKKVIDQFSELEVIARAGVGLDNIDVKYATEKNIPVINAPGVNASTIAEHTISLILMLQRDLFNAIENVKDGNWAERNKYKGDEVNGKTLGILGLGNIGNRVANIGKALGMNVVYWGRQMVNSPYPFYLIEELLQESDIISIHLPLDESTENLIDKKAFEMMKPNALLINTARGQIIDQKELINALEQGKIAGFAADVLSVEPPNPDDKLLKMKNVLITAHVASLTQKTYNDLCYITAQNVVNYLENKEIDSKFIFNKISSI